MKFRYRCRAISGYNGEPVSIEKAKLHFLHSNRGACGNCADCPALKIIRIPKELR